MNEKKKIEKFEGLISDKESHFIQESKAIIQEEEWLVASAGVIFMLLDFMESQTPRMKKVQLAKHLDVSAQYVGKLLRGEENLTLQTMSKIAHVMGMSLSDLISKLSVQLSENEEDEFPAHQFCHEERPMNNAVLTFVFQKQFRVVTSPNTRMIKYSEEATYRLKA